MAERAPKPIPRPRRLGPCAVAIIDLLQEHGVTNPKFFKTHHARVEFVFGGRELTYHFACTPRSSTGAAKVTRAKLSKIMGVPA